MIKTLLLLIPVVLLSACAALQAPPSFTSDPTYWTSQASIAYDILCQTTDIQNHQFVKEINPFLNENPSTMASAAYFIGTAFLNHAIYMQLSEWWPGIQHIWGTGITTMQADVIYKNHQLGLKCW